MKTFTHALARIAAVAALALGAAACGPVDLAIDCVGVCDKYKSCFDANYNTSACVDRCRANGQSADYKRKVDICQACISGRSCTEALFSCATECGGIVP